MVKYVKSAAVNYCSTQYPLFLAGNWLAKHNRKKKSNLWSQTYSWNEGGVKLFRFWEYGPMWSIETSGLEAIIMLSHSSLWMGYLWEWCRDWDRDRDWNGVVEIMLSNT